MDELRRPAPKQKKGGPIGPSRGPPGGGHDSASKFNIWCVLLGVLVSTWTYTFVACSGRGERPLRWLVKRQKGMPWCASRRSVGIHM